jgi:23S rRNA (cytidine1920-2'-O)/16S rRNA (cytidine1409-2'-O)-methyltransferase
MQAAVDGNSQARSRILESTLPAASRSMPDLPPADSPIVSSSMARADARSLTREDVREPVDLVTVDLAFISVTKVLPALIPLARPGAGFLILVKPQFELERGQVGKGGIVRDAALHERAIDRVRTAARDLGLEIFDVRPSRITGAEGNQEFFLYARKPA